MDSQNNILQNDLTESKTFYACRDDQIRAELSESAAISKIVTLYHSNFDPNAYFDVWDQLLIHEALAESMPVAPNYYEEKNKTEEDENASVNGNGNDSCYQKVNFELNQTKLNAISKLRGFTRDSSCIDIAEQLQILFREYPSREGHWLKVAQFHTPRQIIWSINYTLKLLKKGQIRKTPAHCFTYDIFHRKKRIIHRKKEKNL